MIRFEIFDKYSDILNHGFTTRDGGVSDGPFSSLNLGLKTGDDIEKVKRNYRILASALNLSTDSFVFAGQVHGDKVRKIDIESLNSGFAIPNMLEDIDAMITNTPGITLVTVHADCAPVYLFDPVSRSVGLAHSGWKGTLKRIAGKTAEAMSSGYNAELSGMIAVIGPSIGICCFETNWDVYEKFESVFHSIDEFSHKKDSIVLIDLKGIIRYDLLKAGLKPDNIYVSDLCTKCRGDLFFSHRLTGGTTGRMAAVMQLK